MFFKLCTIRYTFSIVLTYLLRCMFLVQIWDVIICQVVGLLSTLTKSIILQTFYVNIQIKITHNILTFFACFKLLSFINKRWFQIIILANMHLNMNVFISLMIATILEDWESIMRLTSRNWQSGLVAMSIHTIWAYLGIRLITIDIMDTYSKQFSQ